MEIKYFYQNLQVAITFRDFIARNPEKKHSIALEILYQMHFFRVSGDQISKSYGHLKIMFKIFYFPFSRYRFHSLPVRVLLTRVVLFLRCFKIHLFKDPKTNVLEKQMYITIT